MKSLPPNCWVHMKVENRTCSSPRIPLNPFSDGVIAYITAAVGRRCSSRILSKSWRDTWRIPCHQLSRLTHVPRVTDQCELANCARKPEPCFYAWAAELSSSYPRFLLIQRYRSKDMSSYYTSHGETYGNNILSDCKFYDNLRFSIFISLFLFHQ